MPQILVREQDYTSPGATEYSNFSVVVPGFISSDPVVVNGVETDRATAYFDENGILEVSSQADFVQKVGKVAPQKLVATSTTTTVNVYKEETVKETTVVITNNDSASDDSDGSHAYAIKIKPIANTSDNSYFDSGLNRLKVYLDSAEDGYELTKTGPDTTNYYTFDLDAGITVEAGKTRTLIIVLDESYNDLGDQLSYYGIQIASKDDSDTAIWAYSPYREVDDEGNVTFVRDSYYEGINLISEADVQFGTESLLAGTEEVETEIPAVPAHYGNQMAYLLLSLGYPIVYVNMGVFDSGNQANMVAAIKALGSDDFWAALRDKATYDYRFVVTGLLDGTADVNSSGEIEGTSEVVAACKAISNLAAFSQDTGGEVTSDLPCVRGDATALLEVDEALVEGFRNGNNSQTAIISAIQKTINATPVTYGKYAAFFTPAVHYSGIEDADYESNTKLPASFHYLNCFIKSLNLGNPEWFAAAGMSRGVSSYTVTGTSYKLGEIAINALEPRYSATSTATDAVKCSVSCNVIAKVRNAYYLWGNRTAYPLGDEGAEDGDLVASHFLNIRQLCSTLKKQIYTACRKYTFDPNSDILWVNFCNAIRPTLEKMKANQGIVDYKIIKVATTQKAKLCAKVRIIPIEAVEDFDIKVSLEDSFGDVSVTVAE